MAAMKKTEESLRKLKKGKKSTFSLFGNSQTDDSRDEERIQAQMILDVEAFGKEAQSLGIELEQNEHYAILKNIVLVHDRKFPIFVFNSSDLFYSQKMHHEFDMFRSRYGQGSGVLNDMRRPDLYHTVDQQIVLNEVDTMGLRFMKSAK